MVTGNFKYKIHLMPWFSVESWHFNGIWLNLGCPCGFTSSKGLLQPEHNPIIECRIEATQLSTVLKKMKTKKNPQLQHCGSSYSLALAC